MNTATLTAMVKAKYSMPEYATFVNVSNGTGSHANRFADAVSMSVWPSRGLSVSGFELKVSRSDWKRELGKPEKAESIFGYCDYWWLVAGDKDIVQDSELPETWGLLVANGTGLKTIKPAPKLEPKPISRVFLAALLRRAKEQDADTEALSAEYQRGRKDGEEHERSLKSYQLKDHEALRKKLAEFEQASGIKIDRYTWNCGRIGELVKLFMRDDAAAQMEQFAKNARQIADEAEKALASYTASRPISAGRKVR